MNIGLKRLARMVASIPSTRCLCYKPERLRLSLSLPPTQAKSKLLRSAKKKEMDAPILKHLLADGQLLIYFANAVSTSIGYLWFNPNKHF